jgi:hypothetical protein
MTDTTTDRHADDWEYGVDAFETAFVRHVGAYGSCDLQDPLDLELFLQAFAAALRENARAQADEEVADV